MFTRPWSTVATEPPPFGTPTTSTDTLSRFMGLSFLGTLMNGLLYGQHALHASASTGKEFEGGPRPYMLDTLKLFLLGWLFESGRRFFDWIKGVFKPFRESHITTLRCASSSVVSYRIQYTRRIWIRRSCIRLDNASSS